MAELSFYKAETFDISETAVTYSSSSGAGFATAGVMQYFRLDYPQPSSPSLSGYLSILWGKGTGTAPTALLGLYAATSTKLYLIGTVSNIGGSSSALIRSQLTMLNNNVSLAPFDVVYGAYLLVTEAGTNKTDVGRSATYATNYGLSALIGADQTGAGQYARAFTGAGTGLSAMPATEALSGVTNAAYLAWMALD
jgi:hypothetical protein